MSYIVIIVMTSQGHEASGSSHITSHNDSKTENRGMVERNRLNYKITVIQLWIKSGVIGPQDTHQDRCHCGCTATYMSREPKMSRYVP